MSGLLIEEGPELALGETCSLDYYLAEPDESMDGRIAAARTALDGAEKASGSARKDALTQLATQLDADAGGAKDSAKTRTLAASVKDLAAKS